MNRSCCKKNRRGLERGVRGVGTTGARKRSRKSKEKTGEDQRRKGGQGRQERNQGDEEG